MAYQVYEDENGPSHPFRVLVEFEGEQGEMGGADNIEELPDLFRAIADSEGFTAMIREVAEARDGRHMTGPRSHAERRQRADDREATHEQLLAEMADSLKETPDA